MEGNVRSGTQDQDEIREHSVPEPATELAAKPLRDPRDPTGAERAIHEATHLPFRSRCAQCVAGRRANPPRHRVIQDDNAEPEILMSDVTTRLKL